MRVQLITAKKVEAGGQVCRKTGIVAYIHPAGRYCCVEWDDGCRECYTLVQGCFLKVDE